MTNKVPAVGYCYGGDPVVIDNIVFDCHTHSTGNGVNIYVIKRSDIPNA